MSDTTEVSTAEALNAAIESTGAVETPVEAQLESPEGQMPVEGAEVQPEQQEQKPAEDQKFAAKFAALNRREQQIKQQAREMKQMRAQLAEQQKALQTKMEQIEAEIKGKYVNPEDLKSPAKAWQQLKGAGMKLEDLAEVVLNDGKETPERLIKTTEEKLLAKIEEMEKREQARIQAEQEAREAQALEQFRNGLKSFVDANENYELIRANDAYEAVYEVITAAYEQRVQEFMDENDREPTHAERQTMILSNKEASDMVEDYLLEEAKKFVPLKKIQGLVAPPAAKQAPAQPVKPQQKTLTNTLSTTVPKTGSKKLSDAESLAEAAKLIKWED